MNSLRVVILGLLVVALTSCSFQKDADQKFGDQHFKTAIALIELHKVRTGAYPESLKDLKYVGDWDQVALNSVKYKKLESGYELDLVKGWVGTPQLHYPADFWTGLGLAKSNMKASFVPKES